MYSQQSAPHIAQALTGRRRRPARANHAEREGCIRGAVFGIGPSKRMNAATAVLACPQVRCTGQRLPAEVFYSLGFESSHVFMV